MGHFGDDHEPIVVHMIGLIQLDSFLARISGLMGECVRIHARVFSPTMVVNLEGLGHLGRPWTPNNNF